ncbi:hypothetical protein PATSB16_07740 [Pandoraea thiooxydans]|uniref:SIMPL domain-containing protein n=1 Tax=Pandoraea thiooxydans TaxID=445709 RepID=A0A0G3EMD0_9BURK|nr:SIMPL domain-containing protein [Pandoraea thiooxydans]AKJ67154.1 hypothetical protein ABW99_01835 [Pandoraea thiooxydans]APR94116.1 hypothetical protein PATSB16_07740 [Pandoraea thiooxydans]
MKRYATAAALLLALGSLSAQARAADAAPSGVLSLDAQANTEVPQDTVQITLFAEQQGSDPAAVSAALNQKATQALKRTKAQTDVSVQTGNVSLDPTSDRNGRISSWRGRTELLLKSRDFAAASRLAGQLSDAMQVGSVSFSLSREAQRAAESKLTAQAISAFKEQAQANSRAFGYSGYTIREVRVGYSTPIVPHPFMMNAMAADKAAAPSVPLEGGKAQVTVNVSGSVQMVH